MKKYKLQSLKEVQNTINWQELKNVLLITDVDGVFFKGIFDPREIIGVISKKNLQIFDKLLKNVDACWILSNRPPIFKYFPFIRQITSSITNATQQTPPLYSDCSTFLEKGLQKYVIILNAKKPSKESQIVVENGLEEFTNVIYIAAQDHPFYFNDKKLINNIANEKKRHFIYIEINPFAKKHE